MNWIDQLEYSRQYEDTRRRRLEHYKPTPRPQRSRAPLRIRLALLLRAVANTLEPASATRPPVTRSTE